MLNLAAFYSGVHGHAPFLWQARLADRVIAEGWPEEPLGLPTASGKTSVLDIAVFALAMQAHRPARERTAPLRTFFVVDRRLVVDDVTKHARKLCDELRRSEVGAVREVRERLLRFGCESPLCVATLRGGMYRSDSWADVPNQPLICVSTVDQVGSRLLFRGYGSGERRRSVDAGLVGCDSLFIVDEAHLSQPFIDTVHSVRRYAGWSGYTFPTLRVVEMSATAKCTETISFQDEIAQDEKLQPRLRASKVAELRETSRLEEEAVAEARRLAEVTGVKLVAVVLNTVAAARAVYEELKTVGEAVLLTGRVRPFDRDQTLKQYGERINVGRNRTDPGALFVVATQTIEVGADLDFDALVTEAASIDALRQRFGRLDRLGEFAAEFGHTEAVILRRKRRDKIDPIYGEAADKTWEWLKTQAEKRGQTKIDFAALRMQELWSAEGSEELNVPTKRAPILTPAHLETWVQTCPTPFPDPDVAPFLHGPEATTADVNLVWRADLEDIERVEDWVDVIQALPPVITEALPVPIWAAQAWLNSESPATVSDMEGIDGIARQEEEKQERQQRPFLIWRGPDDTLAGDPDEIRPGDTIIVRSSEGGADPFGWSPSSKKQVDDIGDQCANQRARAAGGQYVVRLHPSVLAQSKEPEKAQEIARLGELWQTEEDPEALDQLLNFVCSKAEYFDRRQWKEHADPAGHLYFATPWRKRLAREICTEMSDETDQDDTASLTVAVPLDEHVRGVSDRVQHFAKACGLDQELQNALTTAAEAHDLGKCDERFQILLDPGGQELQELLAKGDGNPNKAERDRRRALAGYPKGARHEFWSVALAVKAGDLERAPFRDLILHLIGTHHGQGRPFAPAWEERNGIHVKAAWRGATLESNAADVSALWALGSGWVDRFWYLNRMFGYWGLAYLEAIFRRADCVQSRKEQEKGSEKEEQAA